MLLGYVVYRFGFQVTGTLVVFILLLVLLAKLPESNAVNNTTVTINSTLSGCDDDVSPLNSTDDMAFWVSGIVHYTPVCRVKAHFVAKIHFGCHNMHAN